MTVGSGNETRVISVLDDDDVGVPRSHVERGDDLRSWTQTGSLHDSGGNVDRWREYVTESRAVRMPAEKKLSVQLLISSGICRDDILSRSLNLFKFRCLILSKVLHEHSFRVSWITLACFNKVKSKGFPYSTPSVGPGADPGVQAVSLQVTVSHPPGGRLPLLAARPAVTFPAAEHHRPLAGIKSYCLVTGVHRCEQLAHGCYIALPRVGFEPAAYWSQVQRYTRCATAPPALTRAAE